MKMIHTLTQDDNKKEKELFKAMILAALVGLLSGCASNVSAPDIDMPACNNSDAPKVIDSEKTKMNLETTEGELLFDYDESSVAVVEEAFYDEITIDRTADGTSISCIFGEPHQWRNCPPQRIFSDLPRYWRKCLT